MIRCPNLRDDKGRAAFNGVLERLGGTAMSADDITPRQPYLARLNEKQTSAYHVAHFLWNAHGTPAEIGKFLDELDAVRAALDAEQPKPKPEQKEGTPSVLPAAPPTSKPDVTEPAPMTSLPAIDLARALVKRLEEGKPITSKMLQEEAAKAYGAKLAEGRFDRKDMQDALELAVNLYIKDTRHLRVDSPNPEQAIKMLGEMLDTLPTQRVRSEEQVSFQQFSTPPTYAAAAAYAANIRPGDRLLEPSAGTGSLVAAAYRPGLQIYANELSERRAALLRALIGADGQVFRENAEQLDNTLPESVKPTVVVMNPPFSQTAGRMGDRKMPMVAADHIEQALKRLEPGGRLVAIVGRGMTMGSPTYRAWWTKVSKAYSVRANIGVDGEVYAKYGTNFGTRLLVIDKVAPEAGSAPVLADVASVEDLMRVLDPIRNGRGSTEQLGTEQGGAPLAEGSQGAGAGPLPASAEPGVLGPQDGAGSGVGRPGGAAGAGGRPVRLESGERAGLAGDQPARPIEGRAEGQPADVAGNSGRSAKRGEPRSGDNLEPPGQPEPGTAAGGERVELEHAAPGSQGTAEITDSLYDQYRPQRVRVLGAKPHPSKLVESAAMASVPPPAPKYKPNLPKAVIEKGLLSDAQLEPVIYAGEAHSQMLPAAKDEQPRRKGFFIGDGTGVGKGREVAGIILDNWSQGRTKAIWVSEKQTLVEDAKRDWSGLGQSPDLVFNVSKIKAGEPVTAQKGIGFVTYDTLKGGMSDQAALARGGFVRKQVVSVNGQPGKVARVSKPVRGVVQVTVNLENGTTVTVPAGQVTAVEKATIKSRVDQLVEWFGKDYDGVIAFDEAHNMGNASVTVGERGKQDAAMKAVAGLELQKRLPNARVVYVSATGATEVSNLAYASRLGLWGRGTPFASQDQFMAQIGKGGLAAMELVARDMKALGLYTARNLSYEGVEYQRLEHKLDANQREIYDTLAEAWQVVLQNINAALKLTGGDKDARARSAAMSAFWGGHQRFFSQIVTSLQMPSVIKAVEKDLEAGRQAVLQLTNTNEASQERAAAKAQSAEEIEDLDITPRDQIIQLIETAFPTQQYETYVDENGKERSRPVTDSSGNPVQNREAVAAREALIDKLASIRVPQGPLDMILDHFGVENVAEVTGRGRRFVMKPDEKTGERRRVEESRPGSSNIAETDAFQSGKKKILIFSEAGGTGRSYHADNTSPSKDARRSHYLVQGGWRADKAVQGFGRTHRSNQASAPIFNLVTTDLQGQKRFISSIARRLGQLGALTKGSRQAGDQGIFSARDNLESHEANVALQQFFRDLLAGAVPGVKVDEFERQTGLQLQQKDAEGRSMGAYANTPGITQFLNRLLSLKIDLQNRVFDAFAERMDAVIEARREAGLLDVGLETIRADKVEKVSEQTVHTVEGSGAETKHVQLKVSNKFKPTSFDTVASGEWRKVVKWLESPNGKVYAAAEAPSLTDANGVIVDNYRLVSPVSDARTIAQANVDKRDSKWKTIARSEASALWRKEIESAPEFVTRDMHLITGAILPVFDRIHATRVVRLQTDAGERLFGLVVSKGDLAATLKALGAESKGEAVTPIQLFQKIAAGGRATLANGWKLSRRLVAGEHRIELTGPSSFSEATEVKADGVFTERINYATRYFVPMESGAGERVLANLTRYRPVTELVEAGSAPDDMASGFEAPRNPYANSTPEPGTDNPRWHDLGPFEPEGDAPIAKQAQDYVVERGLDTGREHMVAFDAEGKVVGHLMGRQRDIGLTPALEQALHDPKQAIVIHHNHPSNTALSKPDLAMLAMPGLRALWAHGHGGAVSRAELTDRARAALQDLPPKAAVAKLYEIVTRVGGFIYDPISLVVRNGEMRPEEASAADAEIVGRILDQAGIIHFQSNIDADDVIKPFGVTSFINQAADFAAEKLFNETPAKDRPDRRAQPLRHPGDVGAAFGKPQKAGTRYDVEATADQGRRSNDRQKAKGKGLAENPPRYGPTAAATPNLNQRIRDRIEQALSSNLTNKIIEGTQDLSHPVKLLQDELERRREGAFDDSESFYVRKRLYPGRVGAWTDTFNRKHLDPIVKLLKANEVPRQEADDFLYARHAAERNDEMDKINPGLGGEGSGMSNEEAERILEEARRGEHAAALDDLAERARGISDLILNVMEKAGLEKPEVIAEWRNRYQNYVPLRGWEVPPADAPEDYRGPGAGFNVRGQEVKQALGRRSKADSPLVNLFDQAYRTFDRAERNRYLQSLYRAIEDLGKDAEDIATLDRGKPQRRIDPATGLVRTYESSPLFNDPKAVFLKFDGHPHFIVFRNQELAEAVKRMSPDSVGIFHSYLNLQNKMKALWTHYSPDFLFRHFVFRYPIEGTLNSFEQKEGGEHSVPQYIKDAFPLLGNASKAIFASNVGRAAPDPQMMRYWEEMRRAGGAMMFRNMRDIDLTREHLETALKDLSGSKLANARAKWRRGVEAMDTVTNALDNSLRLAAYASARRSGKSVQQAALIAREATVDFQLKGRWNYLMGIFLPFANVAIQTAARMSQAVYRSRIMRSVFMSTLLAGFVTAAFNYLVAGDDKDGVPFFDKIPDWDRRLNFIILNPFVTDAKGRPEPIKIPMPYNWAFPLTLGHAFGAFMFGQEGPRKITAMIAKSAMETFTPLGSEQNLAAVPTPEAFRPLVHIYTNEDWAGRPVHTDPAFQKRPNAYTARKTTGEGWKAIAEGINKATGGSAGKSGLLDLYPEDYREMIDQFAGTQIRTGQNIWDTAESVAKGEWPDPTKVPLGRVVMGTDYDAADRARAFELRDQIKHPWKH